MVAEPVGVEPKSALSDLEGRARIAAGQHGSSAKSNRPWFPAPAGSSFRPRRVRQSCVRALLAILIAATGYSRAQP